MCAEYVCAVCARAETSVCETESSGCSCATGSGVDGRPDATGRGMVVLFCSWGSVLGTCGDRTWVALWRAADFPAGRVRRKRAHAGARGVRTSDEADAARSFVRRARTSNGTAPGHRVLFRCVLNVCSVF